MSLYFYANSGSQDFLSHGAVLACCSSMKFFAEERECGDSGDERRTEGELSLSPFLLRTSLFNHPQSRRGKRFFTHTFTLHSIITAFVPLYRPYPEIPPVQSGITLYVVFTLPNEKRKRERERNLTTSMKSEESLLSFIAHFVSTWLNKLSIGFQPKKSLPLTIQWVHWLLVASCSRLSVHVRFL